MENRRDSSVWQSLAITFGGGLALGAVGMKLTQEARRPASVAEEPPVRPATLDPRLLDVVIAAVDARLHDHTVETDRRIAEVRTQFETQIAGIRKAVGEELNEFGEAISKLVSDEVAGMVNQRAAAMRSELEASMMQAVCAMLEKEVYPLRAHIAERERELVELRQRLQESERTVLDVILAIGAACQQAAERVGKAQVMPEPAPVVPMAPAPIETPAVASAPVEATPKPPETAAAAEPESQAKPNRLWRVPMVSSFLITTVGLLVAHYL